MQEDLEQTNQNNKMSVNMTQDNGITKHLKWF